MDLDLGAYSSAFVLDIDNDTHLDLFIGQDLGGLFHLENDPGNSVSIIENDQEYGIHIYPNPFADQFHVRKTGFLISETIWITDLSGQKLAEYHIDNEDTLIDVSELDSGMYVVHGLTTGVKIKISKL